MTQGTSNEKPKQEDPTESQKLGRLTEQEKQDAKKEKRVKRREAIDGDPNRATVDVGIRRQKRQG